MFEYKSEEENTTEYFAGLMQKISLFGFVLTIIFFIIYISGFNQPYTSLSTMSENWHLPLAEYNSATSAVSGFDWIRYIKYSDYMCCIGILVLTMATLMPLIVALLPRYFHQKNKLYSGIIILEIIIIAISILGFVTF